MKLFQYPKKNADYTAGTTHFRLRKATLTATVLLLCVTPCVSRAAKDSTAQVSRRKFMALDLKGLAGFYPAAYSRVDGLTGGWGFSLIGKEEINLVDAGLKQVVDNPGFPHLDFSLLVPSARRTAGGTLSMTQTLSQRQAVKAFVELFSATASSDSWRSTQPWSDLIYFVSGNDRQHYYNRRGGRLGLRQELTAGLSLELSGSRIEVRSLSKRGVWTLGKADILTENPPVFPGGDFTLELIARVDRTAGEPFFREGWSAGFTALKGARLLGGDFDYSVWRLDLSGARRLFDPNNYAFAELIAMTSGGRLPPHRLFSLGARLKGFDTFEPDFDRFDRRGDRLWLLNVGFERLLPFRIPLVHKHMRDPGLEVDFDAGSVRRSRPGDSGFDLFTRGLDKIESSVSVGGGVTLSRVRISVFFAHDLDRSYRGPRFEMRVRGSGMPGG